MVVRLEDNTVGTTDDSGYSPVGMYRTVNLQNENGNLIFVNGIVAEVLED